MLAVAAGILTAGVIAFLAMARVVQDGNTFEAPERASGRREYW